MNKMDKIIKDKLYSHSVPVAEDLWDRFEQKAFVENPKKRKALFWILPFLLCIGLSGIGVRYYLINNEVKHSSIANPIESNNQLSIPSNQETEKLELNDEELDESSIPVNESSSVPASSKETDKTNNIPVNHKVQVNKTASVKLGKAVIASGTLNKTTDKNIIKSLSDTKADDGASNVEFANTYLSPIRDINRLILIEPLALQAGLPAFKLPKRAECPKFSPIPPKIYLEAYLSPDIAHKYLLTRSSDIMDKYKNERLDSEYPLISYSGGFRASWISGLGYGIKSGLEFAQINERFDYTDPNSTISKTFITIDTIFHPDGSTQVYTDTSTIKIKGETLYSIYNRFTSLNVPVMLSYEWTFDKLSIGMTAGIEMNLLFSQKGQMLDENLYAQEFTTGKENGYKPFKDNLSLSYVANFGLYYPINKNLEAIIEPHFKLNGASITKDSYPLTQKFATGGLRLGLRYRIGKKN